MSSRRTNSGSHTLTALTFRKGPLCPSSEELLQYHESLSDAVRTPLAETARANLTHHLATCDFCGAELHLLAAHPPQKLKAGACAPVQIPVHLYALARALLTRERHTAPFLEAPHAPAGLTLTDA